MEILCFSANVHQCNINSVQCSQRGNSRKIMPGGGGGPKVELNPKPKKIPILGQFGTQKYIHIKHGTLKVQCFFFSITDHIQENYSYIVRHSRYHTLHIHRLLIYVSCNFTDILRNKCNSHAFYRHFQSNYLSEKHKLPPKLP